MAKPQYIELAQGAVRIPIIHEDRNALAVDKPAGWLLVPLHWTETARNLQAALESSIAAGDFWARSRNLRFLRYVHRLDGDTSGVLLLARSQGALGRLSDLFEAGQVAKEYLAVVRGQPRRDAWTCQLKLAPDPRNRARTLVDPREGKDTETRFQVLATMADDTFGPRALVLAEPLTGRTHQIRVHLAEAGHPVLGDGLYDPRKASVRLPELYPLALRSVRLSYADPFTRRQVRIQAREDRFCAAFGFGPTAPAPAKPEPPAA